MRADYGGVVVNWTEKEERRLLEVKERRGTKAPIKPKYKGPSLEKITIMLPIDIMKKVREIGGSRYGRLVAEALERWLAEVES